MLSRSRASTYFLKVRHPMSKPAFNAIASRNYLTSLDVPRKPKTYAASVGQPPAEPPANDANNIGLQDGTPSKIMDSGSLVSFVSGITAANQVAVLNSTLLAQLGADKAFDRWSDPINWYLKYCDILTHEGWDLSQDMFTNYTASGDTFTMDQAILEIITAIVSQNELAAIKATLDAAKALSTNGKITVFDRDSTQGKAGSFQIGLVKDTGGAIAMGLGSLHYTTDTSVTTVLWFKFSKTKTNLEKRTQNCTLNTDAYSKVKDIVEQKLASTNKDFLTNLDV